ncbi:hypothetical protein ABIE69_000209 [Rhodobacteraceae bacterium MBR-64]|jgi:hypothetical protein
MKHVTFPTAPRNVDELLFHWPAVIRLAETDFAKCFALSIAKQSRRRGWKPSPKQLGIMRAMVSELFAIDDCEVIE